MNTWHTWPLIACAALGLAACGGNSDDPMDVYLEQTLTWNACDPSILGSDTEKTRALWQKMGDRLQCADLRAPIDYDQTERGELSISLLRVAAGQPERRQGAFVMNPGGPGGDGLFMPFKVVPVFEDGNPDSPLGAQQLRLAAEYDFVGFSPRGVGASTRFECATNELSRQPFTGPAARQVPDYFERIAYDQRKRSEACHKNPLARHINTDATVRDMDLLRHVLGQARLNYIGYSYGTWLGSWYASRYPERVGRMLLDSSTDFTAPFEEMNLLQPVARQRLFEQVLAPYAARHPAQFNLGDTAEQVRALPLALRPQIQEALGPGLSYQVYSRDLADTFLDYLSAGQGLEALWRAHPEAETEANEDEDAMHERIEAHDFNPAHPAQNAKARELAHDLWAGVLARQQPEPMRIALDSEGAVFLAIRCNDSPTHPGADYWNALSESYNQAYPLFGGVIDQISCLYWGGPSVTRPSVQAMAGLDVLIAQSEYDAATAAEGALNALEALPKASLVYVPGEFQHALFPYEDDCVDGAITGYLLGQTPSVRITECPAKPLPQDTPQEPSELRKSNRANPPTTYRHPEATRELIREFKDQIGRAEPRPARPRP